MKKITLFILFNFLLAIPGICQKATVDESTKRIGNDVYEDLVSDIGYIKSKNIVPIIDTESRTAKKLGESYNIVIKLDQDITESLFQSRFNSFATQHNDVFVIRKWKAEKDSRESWAQYMIRDNSIDLTYIIVVKYYDGIGEIITSKYHD